MTIKKCERAEYTQTLAMMNKAFGMGEHEFEEMMPSLTPYEKDATDEQIARHFIAVKDGVAIGCVGAYPRGVIVSGEPYDAFGIGQVCCAEEERERGVMSALMNAAVEDSVRNGAVLGYLGGNIPRYRHFGFHPAGAMIEFMIKTRRIKNVASEYAAGVIRADLHDAAKTARLYERFMSRAARTDAHWEEILSRGTLECYYAPGPEGAYLIADKRDGSIAELQGGAAEAAGLLIFYAGRRGIERVTVRYPFLRHTDDKLYNMLYEYTDRFAVHPTALAAIYGDGAAAERLKEIYWTNGTCGDFWISGVDEV